MIRANNKPKSKQIASIAVIIVLLSVLIFFSILNYWHSEATIKYKYSFSDLYGVDFDIEENEKSNINDLLYSLTLEDSYYFGFTDNTNTTVDLYTANSLVQVSKLIPEYELTSLEQSLSFIVNTRIDNLDFLNLTYYMQLCLNLGIELDYTNVFSALLNYYDKEADLFFIDSEDDSINVKLIASSMVKRILGDRLSQESFNLEDGIRKAYELYDFKSQRDITFYNSGGDILYCISVFGMGEEIDKEKLEPWFEYWKDYYESIPIDSLIHALQYSEYLNVACFFEPDYSAEKLQDYYSNLTAEDIDTMDDVFFLYNVIKNSSLLDNTVANKKIESKIEEIINNEELFISNINIEATAYGVILARKTGYPLNEDKLQNLIQQNYSDLPLIENLYERSTILYYNIILDQLMNGYDREYDDAYFQLQVDNILRSLEYDQSIVADVVTARRTVEVVMDLQLFDVDIKLTKTQRNKIQKGFEKALEDNSIKNSVFINDIFIVDKALALKIISDKEFVEIFNSLQTNGGVCAYISDDIEPDIVTTYRFMVSLGRINNYSYLDAQKLFAETLMTENGLYKLNIKANDMYNLPAVTYANAIRHLEIGGYKDDNSK